MAGALTLDLQRMSEGDVDAEARVFATLKRELGGLAGHFMRQQGPHHTLQTTALVNEVYLRVNGPRGEPWRNRKHFLDVAAKAMRCVLIDHARARHRLRRAPVGERIALTGIESGGPAPNDLLDIEESLEALASFDDLAARVVRYRFYLGLPMPDVARSLGSPLRTVERKWRFARAYIYERLK